MIHARYSFTDPLVDDLRLHIKLLTTLIFYAQQKETKAGRNPRLSCTDHLSRLFYPKEKSLMHQCLFVSRDGVVIGS